MPNGVKVMKLEGYDMMGNEFPPYIPIISKHFLDVDVTEYSEYVNVEMSWDLNEMKLIEEIKNQNLYVKILKPDKYNLNPMPFYEFKRSEMPEIYKCICLNANCEIVGIMVGKYYEDSEDGLNIVNRLEIAWTC
jgi:hypothetical protein